MEDTKVKSRNSAVRDSQGRFVKGHTIVQRVPKGYAGKSKGAKRGSKVHTIRGGKST